MLPAQADVQVDRDRDDPEHRPLAADVDESGQNIGTALELEIDPGHRVHGAAGHAEVQAEVSGEPNRAPHHLYALGAADATVTRNGRLRDAKANSRAGLRSR